MYVPNIHKPQKKEDVYEYIRNNGFATLISQINGRFIASHIPLLLDLNENGIYRLLGHIAVGNEQKDALLADQEVLAIFMETHAYISSSWYDHINVPTWNYVAVHVYGTPRVLVGEELHESIHQIVEHYESGRENRFHLNDMPSGMLKAHLEGIIGFEIPINKIESSFKLSQNRNANDYANVIDKLENTDDEKSHNIAKEMKKYRL